MPTVSQISRTLYLGPRCSASAAFCPALIVFEVLAALVDWARVELGVHTPARVIGGGIIGAVVPAAVFVLLRSCEQ